MQARQTVRAGREIIARVAVTSTWQGRNPLVGWPGVNLHASSSHIGLKWEGGVRFWLSEGLERVCGSWGATDGCKGLPVVELHDWLSKIMILG